MARATVTASRAEGGIRATVSGSDGVYSFADLPPGSWTITIEADGHAAVTAPPLSVVANKATRYDVAMSGAAAAPAAPVAATVTTPTPALVASVPEALQAPEPSPEVDTRTPFADTDTTWANGTTRNSTPIFDTKFFTPEIRLDVNYLQSFNQPKDHTIVGSTEEFRSGEFQIEQVSFGGDFHWHNVARVSCRCSASLPTTTPRNDASRAIGKWDLRGHTDTSRKRMRDITST